VKVGLRIEGGERLAKTLLGLPSRVSRNVMLNALKAGAEPMRATASRLAPRDPGAPDLADNIGISNARPGGGISGVAIGPTTNFFYGSFQEFGTTRHGAQPFMRPAFDSDHRITLQIVTNQAWEALSKRGFGARGSSTGGIGDSFGRNRPSVSGGAGGGGLL
jgi:HK97 gp10 family phage protein